MGFPLPPARLTETVKACWVLMADKDGLTETTGVILVEAVTVSGVTVDVAP